MRCMSSSTESSVVTAPKPRKAFLLFFLFFLTSRSVAECHGPLKPLPADAATWSTDLYVREVLDLSQRHLPKCPGKTDLKKRIAELQSLYLKRLGLKRTTPDRLFRLLIAGREDVEGLRLAATDLHALEKKTQWIGNIPLLGATATGVRNFEALLASLGIARNRFWDDRVLYKITVIQRDGVAAFIPELATLVVSKSLLELPTHLNHLVLLHELAHTVEHSAFLFQGEDWKKEFAKFSGWPANFELKVETLSKIRADDLTQLSEKSPFSLLPDSVIAPAGKDGFVFAKAYRATKEQKDVSEDIADHIAAFALAPERFCFNEKPLAPGKYAWVKKKVFPDAEDLKCIKESP